MKMDKVQKANIKSGKAFVHVERTKCGEVGDYVVIDGVQKVLFAVELMPLGTVSRTLHAAAGFDEAAHFYGMWLKHNRTWHRKQKVWVHFFRSPLKCERMENWK